MKASGAGFVEEPVGVVVVDAEGREPPRSIASRMFFSADARSPLRTTARSHQLVRVGATRPGCGLLEKAERAAGCGLDGVRRWSVRSS